MKLEEAIKSGLPFRRKGDTHYMTTKDLFRVNREGPAPFVESILPSLIRDDEWETMPNNHDELLKILTNLVRMAEK